MNRINHDGLELARAELGKSDKNEIFVRRLKGSESLTMTVYSPQPWGVQVHWSKATRRSSPHFTDSKRCPGCQDDLPRKSLFYIFGFEIEQTRLIYLELTEKAGEAIKKQLGFGETMRGIGLYVSRTPANNGRLQVRVMNSHPAPQTLPPDRDPHDTLMRLWRIGPGDSRGGKEFPTTTNGFLSRNGHE